VSVLKSVNHSYAVNGLGTVHEESSLGAFRTRDPVGESPYITPWARARYKCGSGPINPQGGGDVGAGIRVAGVPRGLRLVLALRGPRSAGGGRRAVVQEHDL
jgi:hypothetical protein